MLGVRVARSLLRRSVTRRPVALTGISICTRDRHVRATTTTTTAATAAPAATIAAATPFPRGRAISTATHATAHHSAVTAAAAAASASSAASAATAAATAAPGGGGVHKNEVWSWGAGHLGGTGHDTYDFQNEPLSVAPLRNEDIVRVSSGWSRSYALSANGDVWWWGWHKTFKHLLSAQRVSARFPGLLSVLQSPWLRWLGHAVTMRGAVPVPTLMGADAFDGAAIVQIASGGDHTVALDDQGRVWTWGVGYYGQLGHGAHTSQTHVQRPRVVQALWPAPGDGTTATGTAASAASSPATPDASSSSADAPATPAPVPPPPRTRRVRIVSVSAGFQHTLMLSSDGQVYATGKGVNGTLGIWRIVDGPDSLATEKATANTVHKRLDVPGCVQVMNQEDVARHARPLMGDVKLLGAGFAHSVFVDVHGKVWTCGKGRGGELGHGDFEDQTVPKRVDGGGLHSQVVTKLAVGQHHTVVLTAAGVVYTWGRSKQGQCGRSPQDAVVSATAARLTRDETVAAAATTMPVPGVMKLDHLPPAARRIVDVYAGFYDTVLINDQGQAIWCGGNASQDGVQHVPTLLHAGGDAAPHVVASAQATGNSTGAELPWKLSGARVHGVAFGLGHALAVVSPRT